MKKLTISLLSAVLLGQATSLSSEISGEESVQELCQMLKQMRREELTKKQLAVFDTTNEFYSHDTQRCSDGNDFRKIHGPYLNLAEDVSAKTRMKLDRFEQTCIEKQEDEKNGVLRVPSIDEVRAWCSISEVEKQEIIQRMYNNPPNDCKHLFSAYGDERHTTEYLESVESDCESIYQERIAKDKKLWAAKVEWEQKKILMAATCIGQESAQTMISEGVNLVEISNKEKQCKQKMAEEAKVAEAKKQEELEKQIAERKAQEEIERQKEEIRLENLAKEMADRAKYGPVASIMVCWGPVEGQEYFFRTEPTLVIGFPYDTSNKIKSITSTRVTMSDGSYVDFLRKYWSHKGDKNYQCHLVK